MDVDVLEYGTRINKKTGEVTEFAKCLVHVMKFGSLSLELITVVLPIGNSIPKKLGKHDLDIILPHSDYDYFLKSSQKN